MVDTLFNFMNILVACEESQRVADAFRKKGHNAFSCDIIPTSGNHPEYHIIADVTKILNLPIFFTQDYKMHIINSWDMLIAFPPCTYLSNVAAPLYNIDKYHEKAVERLIKRERAKKFFYLLYNTNINKICIENPVGCINKELPPTQIINPFNFGEPYQKRTCLWLKNLEPLPIKYTKSSFPGVIKNFVYGECGNFSYKSGERSKMRSKTFISIANAMAERWG